MKLMVRVWFETVMESIVGLDGTWAMRTLVSVGGLRVVLRVEESEMPLVSNKPTSVSML